MKINESLLRGIILNEINNAIRFNPNRAHLYKLFATINRQCFQRKLPMCGLVIKSMNGKLGLFSYEGRDNRGKLINPKIFINGDYQYTMEELEGLMAHEMIHYYLAYNGMDPRATHGKEFKDMANRISQMLGVPITDEIDTSNIPIGQTNTLGISPTLLAYMKSYKGSFENYLPKIKQEGKNKDGEMRQFYNAICFFTKDLIYALDRAINKRSLNEANFMKPINDFISGYKRGYNATLNALVGNDNYGFKNVYNNPYYSYSNMNGESDKKTLIDLLYNHYPPLRRKYEKNAMGYSSNLISTLFATVDDLKARIDNEAHSNGQQSPQMV